MSIVVLLIPHCLFILTGIWPDGADGTDVNSVDRSNGKQLLATGDDFGNVNLYRYPCVSDKVRDHPEIIWRSSAFSSDLKPWKVLKFCPVIFLESDFFGRSWRVLEICKFRGKFSDTKKERSKIKLNRVEEIPAKCE